MFLDLISAIYPNQRIWIGVTRLVGRIWKNVDDGENTTYFNWATGQPWTDPDHQCVSIDFQGYWYSGYGCDTYSQYVCGVHEVSETGSTSSPTK